MAKNKISEDESEIPEVIPFMQTEMTEDGVAVTKTVKPLTYSLMSWVKRTMNLPDTIDISEDENSAEWVIDVPSLDESFEFKAIFETYEESGLIRFFIYYFDEPIPEELIDRVNQFILEKNLYCPTGQLQILDTGEVRFLRYVSGVSVAGIASEDPNYSGDFQIKPKLYDNMFSVGFGFMNDIIDEFKDLINDE